MDDSPVWPFILLLVCAGILAAVFGLQMLVGFIAGAVTVLLAALVAVASEDFYDGRNK